MAIDTIRITSNLDVFEDVFFDFWSEELEELETKDLFELKPRKIVKSLKRLRKFNSFYGCTGAYLRHDLGTEEVIFEFSAKTLGLGYLKGISENTIEIVIENLNKIGETKYKLNKYKFVENSYVGKVHNTFSVEVKQEDVITLIDSIKAVISWNYKTANFSHLTSAIFENNQEGLIFYSKLEELMRNSRSDGVNSKFIKMIERQGNNNLIRVENKKKTAKKTREEYSKVIELKQFSHGRTMSGLEVPFSEALKNSTSSAIFNNTLKDLNYRSDGQELFGTSEMYNMIKSHDYTLNSIIKTFGHDGVFEGVGRSREMLRLALKERFGPDRARLSKKLKEFEEGIVKADRFRNNLKEVDCYNIVRNFKKKLEKVIEQTG